VLIEQANELDSSSFSPDLRHSVERPAGRFAYMACHRGLLSLNARPRQDSVVCDPASINDQTGTKDTGRGFDRLRDHIEQNASLKFSVGD